MKVLLSLAVLATTATAFASESREIQDIMYLPNAGTTYGFSEMNWYKGETKFEQSGVDDVEQKGEIFSQTLGHAWTDRLSTQLSINYANIDTEVDGGGGETTQSGWSDPSAQLKFRTVDESFKWDVIVGGTVGLGDRELEEDGDLNNYRGGNSVYAGTQFGGKSVSFQWAILGLVRHNMEQTTEIENGASVDADAYNDLHVRADILNTLGEKTYLRSNVQATFGEDYDFDDDTVATVNNTGASSSTYSIGTELQHKLSRDVMLRAGVDYGMINQQSAQIDEQNFWNYRAGVNYQF